MRYLPKSDSERKHMLQTMGLESTDQLFSHIPAAIRLKRPLQLPAPYSEPALLEFFKTCAAENATGMVSFLGAGMYRHFIPIVVDHLISRTEFYSAYTPYQPEVSQGTLQAIFEFQSLMCQLTGMDVANASMYDGATAMTESALMAQRITSRTDLLVAETVHPEYREVLLTYTRHLNTRVRNVAFTESGQVDLDDLKKRLSDKIAAVIIQSPNFFGNVEQLEEIARLAHERGALLVVAVAESLSLGLLRPPGQPTGDGQPVADIVAGEGQSLGIPISYGGPVLGFIATRDKHVRQMPGRLVGQTVDTGGQRGFVLTLATREQHIRREKATSNICTNQALCALMCTIYLSLLGKEGLREIAIQNVSKSQYAISRFKTIESIEVLFNGPRFNEFVIRSKERRKFSDRKLWKQKLVGGVSLKRFYPRLKNAELLCVTELTPKVSIDTLVDLYQNG
ncbi:MAG: aminomethyl-transferring glycine dehydrogenase subunit GcvPA [Acidobacteriia bacterium]|nr:aminomethyl-transferring glycine dehydrogenase subunit GcvPA [Terriglobia bacterium]